jgi:hypothetical protein
MVVAAEEVEILSDTTKEVMVEKEVVLAMIKEEISMENLVISIKVTMMVAMGKGMDTVAIKATGVRILIEIMVVEEDIMVVTEGETSLSVRMMWGVRARTTLPMLRAPRLPPRVLKRVLLPRRSKLGHKAPQLLISTWQRVLLLQPIKVKKKNVLDAICQQIMLGLSVLQFCAYIVTLHCTRMRSATY